MTLNEALRIKNDKRMAEMNESDKRRAELHAVVPRIKEIDLLLDNMPLRLLGGENAEIIRAEDENLRSERARLLEATGFAPDYDMPKFDCPECNDGGYCGLKLCQCIKNMLSADNYQKSTLAGGLVGKTFDVFSLDYYTEGSERQQMEIVLNVCKKYAENFPKFDSAGMLFLGGTGLGKTHLSAAIANSLSTRGISVVYESAQQIFDTVDAVRFNRMDISERKKYETCSLLIIDDLGAECITQYSISSITSLIDLRIVNGKKTIISSNLSLANIKKTYGERLFSRLLGEYHVLQFVGKDIRMMKNKGC
ncbi:MAG: ATP-binding protein [Clostridia bacterium]|nr:ATP-binding protein [Clostridia bacterium]